MAPPSPGLTRRPLPHPSPASPPRPLLKMVSPPCSSLTADRYTRTVANRFLLLDPTYFGSCRGSTASTCASSPSPSLYRRNTTSVANSSGNLTSSEARFTASPITEFSSGLNIYGPAPPLAPFTAAAMSCLHSVALKRSRAVKTRGSRDAETKFNLGRERERAKSRNLGNFAQGGRRI